MEYFIRTAESDTFRTAAERLGISQPTLSSQLATLEQRLQVSLFERTRIGVMLSPAGREFLPNCRMVLTGFLMVIETS
ncbi:MAG: LysR family transcriptional regulator [Pseudomonadales bacterium]|nr:LysR family transcriptional regulator [Pseudomonadales bacterium]